MKKKLFLIFFIAIVLLGSILRFYQLDNIPGSLEWDEASYGYNAYSLQNTGMDEYGKRFPITFRAFGDYKQPVYMYLEVASISTFGLNAFAVRFPAALFGSLSIIFVYLLTYELFRKFKYVKTIALLSMFFFAISPWAIQFSRAAFEATVSLSFVLAGVWLFLRGLKTKKPWYFFLSILILSISSYTYISQKVILPFIFASFMIYGLSYFKKKKKLAGILIIIFIVLNSLWLLDTKSVSRGQGVLLTNNQTEILDESIKQMQFDNEAGDTLGSLLHNRRIVYTQSVITNYLSHYNPLWLFVTGDDSKRHHAPGFGLLYLASLPLILAGIYFLLSRAFSTAWPLFLWFLAAPLAASLTFDAPHSLRSLIFLPTWQIFEAAGIVFILLHIKRELLKRSLLAVFAVLLLFNFTYYLHQYFVHINTDFQKDWQYGYKEAIEYVDNESYSNKRIVFSKNFEQPYIFYLFYNKYDPAKYISEGTSWRTSQKCYTIDNAYFGDCLDKLRPGDIYVSSEDTVIDNTKELKRFNYTDGEPSTRIFEYQ